MFTIRDTMGVPWCPLGARWTQKCITCILNQFQATVSFDLRIRKWPLPLLEAEGHGSCLFIVAHLQAWASHVGQWGLEKNSSEERATVLLCAGEDSGKIPGRSSTHCDVPCCVCGYLTVKTFSVWVHRTHDHTQSWWFLHSICHGTCAVLLITLCVLAWLCISQWILQ